MNEHVKRINTILGLSERRRGGEDAPPEEGPWCNGKPGNTLQHVQLHVPASIFRATQSDSDLLFGRGQCQWSATLSRTVLSIQDCNLRYLRLSTSSVLLQVMVIRQIVGKILATEYTLLNQ